MEMKVDYKVRDQVVKSKSVLGKYELNTRRSEGVGLWGVDMGFWQGSGRINRV